MAVPQSATTALYLPHGASWNLTQEEVGKGGYYGGLPIHADSVEVHERALELLEAYCPAPVRILDVGAGPGAFSKRLVDRGYHVEAIEIRPDAFLVPNVPVYPLNLQEDWASQLPCRYDALAALEVFEHLENPWHFARQCAAALTPGGVLVLTTPNIESSRSRIEFLLQAEFRFFDREAFQKIGHITSMTTNQIRWAFGQAGMELVERRYSRHKGIWKPGNPKRTLRAFLYALSYPFMRGTKLGEASVFLFRKS